VSARFPALSIPDGIANGDADDTFDWQGMPVTAHWVMYLTRAANFYNHVDPAQVTSILEIGPDLGLSSLAHLALNPHLRVIVNVDIVSVAYVSSCLLSSSAALQVTDYAAVRALETIDIALSGDKPRLWSLPKIRGQFDYAFNAFSFQEMEEAVCENYAREVMRLTRRGVHLHSRTGGHKVNACGQAKPITMEDLQAMLQAVFPHGTVIGDLWAAAAQRPASEAILLRPA
jgi:putative sugar O-methyltransferase